MNEPTILRQREVEQLLIDHHHLRVREARVIVADDVIPRTAIEGVSHRRWLRADVLAFDVVAHLRNTGRRQGQSSNGPCESTAATATCP